MMCDITLTGMQAYTSTALAANILCDLLIAGTTVQYLQAGRTVFHR